MNALVQWTTAMQALPNAAELTQYHVTLREPATDAVLQEVFVPIGTSSVPFAGLGVGFYVARVVLANAGGTDSGPSAQTTFSVVEAPVPVTVSVLLS